MNDQHCNMYTVCHLEILLVLTREQRHAMAKLVIQNTKGKLHLSSFKLPPYL
jgi:hypothetical protein